MMLARALRGLVECRAGRADRPQFHTVAGPTGIRSIAFWSRPFCKAYENGRKVHFFIVFT